MTCLWGFLGTTDTAEETEKRQKKQALADWQETKCHRSLACLCGLLLPMFYVVVVCTDYSVWLAYTMVRST